MDYAKVLIIDTNIGLYDYSTGIWAEYGIKSHHVDDIEKALEELSVYKYHLIVIVECKDQRPIVLDCIKLSSSFTCRGAATSSDFLRSGYAMTSTHSENTYLPVHIQRLYPKDMYRTLIERRVAIYERFDIANASS